MKKAVLLIAILLLLSCGGEKRKPQGGVMVGEIIGTVVIDDIEYNVKEIITFYGYGNIYRRGVRLEEIKND